jgi:rare lipoprotein A
MILCHLGTRRNSTPDKTMNLTRKIKSVALAIAGVLLIPSCAMTSLSSHTGGKAEDSWPIQSVQQGKASWYSIRTNGGTRTASGMRLNNASATAAHKTLPIGSKVRVINLINGKSEVVVITDRGPYVRDRVIDVTIGVAERLGFASHGVVPVKLEVLN